MREKGVDTDLEEETDTWQQGPSSLTGLSDVIARHASGVRPGGNLASARASVRPRPASAWGRQLICSGKAGSVWSILPSPGLMLPEARPRQGHSPQPQPPAPSLPHLGRPSEDRAYKKINGARDWKIFCLSQGAQPIREGVYITAAK
ncbi:hypothetical protein AAFF_G00396570 [Aldrovandia affinis]|uniref:Uncharacterized protein n=1 Tax=Aldrovandia affinis TaxID=143900 RepID=A0AAD7SDX4_9TELE|nr:hypothetical protein AAFF_G00396570 [Aldrovandia affinis]